MLRNIAFALLQRNASRVIVSYFELSIFTIGILSFTASTNQINAGESVTLSWNVQDVRRVEIRPALGSVGAYTATNGVGSMTVTVTNSTEFVLIATNAAATKWAVIPSIGVDAVKVTGANMWKSLAFKSEDLHTLLDENGSPLLMGGRRVHFKMVLAHELSNVSYQGLSYITQDSPKK